MSTDTPLSIIRKPLPVLDFVSPPEEAQENHILEEEDSVDIHTLRKGAYTYD